MTSIIDELKHPFIIDGAMSTALEALGADDKNPLWTASALDHQPDLVKKVHSQYFAAGARLAITDTYQANVPAFIKQGYSKRQARALIRRAVELAKEARDDYERRTGIHNYVAGSLGPYGAYLNNGAEYTGDYHLGSQQYQDFHRPRLTEIAQVGVDILAIETQPRLDEVQAELTLARQLAPTTPVYVSFSLKNHATLPDGTPLAVAAETVARDQQVAAVGVNCIPLERVAPAVRIIHASTDKPVIAYPNSSAVYDPPTKSWTYPNGHQSLASFLPQWLSAGLTMIGGCCTTTPSDIQLLSDRLPNYLPKEETVNG